jgi:tetratricopeptide (TPR) repeat protein
MRTGTEAEYDRRCKERSQRSWYGLCFLPVLRKTGESMVRGQKSHRASQRIRTALKSRRYERALRLYEELEACEPKEPRWPLRKGDLLLRMERKPDALEAYERAVELYLAQGFVSRATATAKVIAGIDPSRANALERAELAAAERSYRVN